MASSTYQRRNEEIKRVNPLSSEEVHFVETCCHILGLEYQNNAQRIGSEVVEAGRRDPERLSRQSRAF